MKPEVQHVAPDRLRPERGEGVLGALGPSQRAHGTAVGDETA